MNNLFDLISENLGNVIANSLREYYKYSSGNIDELFSKLTTKEEPKEEPALYTNDPELSKERVKHHLSNLKNIIDAINSLEYKSGISGLFGGSGGFKGSKEELESLKQRINREFEDIINNVKKVVLVEKESLPLIEKELENYLDSPFYGLSRENKDVYLTLLYSAFNHYNNVDQTLMNMKNRMKEMLEKPEKYFKDNDIIHRIKQLSEDEKDFLLEHSEKTLNSDLFKKPYSHINKNTEGMTPMYSITASLGNSINEFLSKFDADKLSPKNKQILESLGVLKKDKDNKYKINVEELQNKIKREVHLLKYHLRNII